MIIKKIFAQKEGGWDVVARVGLQSSNLHAVRPGSVLFAILIINLYLYMNYICNYRILANNTS